MPTAITHDPSFTTPVSSTNTALVRWSGTGGDTVLDTSGILSNGSSITLNARGEVRFADADSSHYIALESPATVSTSYTMALPAAVPSANDYLKVTSYSGGAGVLEWAAAGGKIGQVVTDTMLDSFTTTSSSFTGVTGLSVSITPTATNSKIYVSWMLNGSQEVGSNRHQYRVIRNQGGITPIAVGTAAGSRVGGTGGFGSADASILDSTAGGSWVDSPSTTSAVAYEIQVRRGAGSGTVYVNRSHQYSNDSGTINAASSITVMEILN